MDRSVTIFMFLLQIIHFMTFYGTFWFKFDHNMIKDIVGYYAHTESRLYSRCDVL